jgi:hypothetical protein
MYFAKNDVFNQYLLKLDQYLVNVCPAGERPGLYVPQRRADCLHDDFCFLGHPVFH